MMHIVIYYLVKLAKREDKNAVFLSNLIHLTLSRAHVMTKAFFIPYILNFLWRHPLLFLE